MGTGHRHLPARLLAPETTASNKKQNVKITNGGTDNHLVLTCFFCVYFRIVLCYTVLCCIVLCCIVLCCVVLYCIVFYCIVCCIVLYCIVLFCVVLYSIELYGGVLCCLFLNKSLYLIKTLIDLYCIDL